MVLLSQANEFVAFPSLPILEGKEKTIGLYVDLRIKVKDVRYSGG